MKYFTTVFFITISAFFLTSCSAYNIEKTMPVIITIECSAAVGSYSELSENKRKLLPSDGIFVSEYEVLLFENATCFDALLEVCETFKLHVDHSGFASMTYVKGIGNLYEFDLSAESGWLYSVNGEEPKIGSNGYKLKSGDVLKWFYSVKYEE